MAHQKHINPLLFVTDCLTKSNTSVPNSTASSSDTNLAPVPSHPFHHSGLYQPMASKDERSPELLVDRNAYVVEEYSSLGMDDVTPPKQSKETVKRLSI
ncbi:hypothetical protein O181_035484 [Austropuccinia psidii MF-1]|uniref:Uncharacterized protein n=1 Tax=Austropuccinia psidii MF-1 TaxID=1389203 RepID=A0A9Q3D2R0_9BASI|nr:hypothetical protein [Austropuccinia psidii MF-1]